MPPTPGMLPALVAGRVSRHHRVRQVRTADMVNGGFSMMSLVTLVSNSNHVCTRRPEETVVPDVGPLWSSGGHFDDPEARPGRQAWPLA